MRTESTDTTAFSYFSYGYTPSTPDECAASIEYRGNETIYHQKISEYRERNRWMPISRNFFHTIMNLHKTTK